jgi:O-succinylbenzoate synthase
MAAPPATRFAIETALLDALARSSRVSIAALLAPLVERLHAPLVERLLAARTTTGPRPAAGRAASLAAASLGAGPRTPGHVTPGHAALGHAAPAATSSVVPGSAAAGSVAAGPAAEVPLAAVVDDPASAQRAFAAGIRCLKIKLAAADDPERVRAIAAAAPGARLRIDANRSWPRDEVIDRLAALAALPIDYVEEPCREAHRLLAAPLPCPLALDESLLAMTSDEILAALASPQLAALVLKPTLLGGFSVVLPLAARARRAGRLAIVSHALEGPIGMAACAELALALGGNHAVGLAPHAALVRWPLAVPQLAADRVRAAGAPGLGYPDLDLAGASRV